MRGAASTGCAVGDGHGVGGRHRRGLGAGRAAVLVVGEELATASRIAAAVATSQQTSDEQGCTAVEGSQFAVAYPR